MAFIRQFEQRVWDLSAENPPKVIGSVHLCAGQEAIPVGACAALRKDDQVVATYRGHGWALAWGLDPQMVMDEILHRGSGLNGGRAGSALMMAPRQGFVGENSIVGAGAPIADGVALAMQSLSTNGVVLVSLGDGATNQGATHEAMVFAVARRLPVIFVIENNGWSEMTPISRIVPFSRLAKRAGGYGMPGVTINGNDPVVVRDSMAMAIERARAGDGPALIECTTQRLWGHYNRDIEHYRPKDDRAAAEAADPLASVGKLLISDGSTTAAGLEEIRREVADEVEALVRNSIDAELPVAAGASDHIYSRVPATAVAARKPAEGAAMMTYQQAVNEALRRELADRPEVLVYGEDVGHGGGIFGCTRNLQREFGESRVFDTPIAEAAILGSAVGAAMMGMRPIAEIMWADFVLVAMDQLINQAANVCYITRGEVNLPMVVRMQQGATPGSCAQHSQSLEALFAHIPGLKIGIPATPQDAYSMLRAAVSDPDPCIIFEARSLYQTKGPVDLDCLEEVGGLRCARQGGDLSIITYGTMLGPVLAAADALQQKNIHAQVIDLRWLNPLQWDELAAAVQRTGGKALIAHEANLTGGFGAEILARLVEAGAGKVGRMGAPDVRIPASPHLQKQLLPQVADIVTRAESLL